MSLKKGKPRVYLYLMEMNLKGQICEMGQTFTKRVLFLKIILIHLDEWKYCMQVMMSGPIVGQL